MSAPLPGRLLFLLKDSHGLPLEVALDRVAAAGATVEWPSFVEAAREAGWYDFQTYDALRYALQDSFMPQTARGAVLAGFKRYVLARPHPCVAAP